MAPLLKLTLSFSLLASTALAAHSPKDGSRGHIKMVKRTVQHDKRHDKGPYGYGYDRCGVPRTSPYVKKRNGPSASPSAKWKPCPSMSSFVGPDGVAHPIKTPSPAKNAAPVNNVDGGSSSASATPTGYWDDGDDEDSDDMYVDPSATSTSWDAAGAAPTESYVGSGSGNANGYGNDAAAAAVAPSSSSWSSSASGDWIVPSGESTFSAPGAPSTIYTTQVADNTVYTTTYPDATPTSSSWTESSSSSSSWSEEAGSSSSASSEGSNQRNMRIAYGNNNAPSSSSSSWVDSSSSSSSWVEPSSSSSSWVAPSSSSTSEAPEATPNVPAYTGNNSGKLGLAWDWLNPPNTIGQWGKASKVYTWSAYPPPGLPSNIEFLPQYWGPSKESDMNSQIGSGAIKPGMTILGFNEPDQVGQANMAVADGVREYKRLLTPLASQGYKLATPGCTSDDNGFNWIKSFIEQCGGSCGFSILQTHYYGTDPDAFIAYIQKLRQFGLPIIVSEFAAETFGSGVPTTDAQVQSFLAKTQSWLNAQDDVLAYMFFGTVTKGQAGGVSPANLMFANDATAQPNALGWQYLNGA